ncbi:hypothetical protein IRZ60_00435 [Pseudomonas guariconensis]|nr:hypothetical protein [Pseudomonas guariconensis]MBF8749040.1 hypothetical protein [Pseudomonas guariconensis]
MPPRDKVSVLAHGEELQVVDPGAVIQRHACRDYGAALATHAAKQKGTYRER